MGLWFWLREVASAIFWGLARLVMVGGALLFLYLLYVLFTGNEG